MNLLICLSLLCALLLGCGRSEEPKAPQATPTPSPVEIEETKTSPTTEVRRKKNGELKKTPIQPESLRTRIAQLESVAPQYSEPTKDLPAEPRCEGRQDGDVLEVRSLAKKSPAELSVTSLFLGFSNKFSTEMFQVIYCTPGTQRELVVASGALFVPFNSQGPLQVELPLMSYQHGTQAQKTGGPSDPNSTEGQALMAIASALEVITVAPEYLGLGESSGAHPYLHAASEASAAVSLLKAARTLSKEKHYKLNNDLYILGYSQGGHATMALHKHLEETSNYNFNLKASAPMAGPYDLSQFQVDSTLTDPSKMSIFYSAYIVSGMQRAYNLFGDYSQLIRPKYIKSVMPLFKEGRYGSDEYLKRLPKTVGEFFTDEALEALEKKDRSHPLYQALDKNSLVNWAPQAPVLLLHSKDDEAVAYENSVIAQKTMKKLGAKDVQLVTLKGNHAEAIFPAFSKALKWIDGIIRPASQALARKPHEADSQVAQK